MNVFLQDIRYAIRQLSKNPGFTAVAVITLALGIAVNSTMFSLVSGFLLQRPPGRDPEHVVVISSVNPDGSFHADAYPVSPPNFLAWREANHVFTDVAADDEYRTVSLTGDGRVENEALRAEAVSPNYFSVLDAAPQLGRAFSAGEDQPGRDHVVILSHDLWVRRFGSDSSILHQTVRINRESYSVIGVMSERFRMLGNAPQLWIPLVLKPTDQTAAARKNRSLHLFARLQPGVTLDQVRAEVTTLARRAEHDFPEAEKGWGATARTLPDFLVYDFGIRTGPTVLMTTVGLVLLIACANVAGLLLARAAGRQKELSLRISLGASRLRIIRQVLTEGLVIALLGGGVGLLLAHWGINFVRAQMAFNEAFSTAPLSLDRNVLLFALSISVVSALLCGLAPALNASATDINAHLKDESRGASQGRSHARLRTVLVTGEIALSLFLLIGTGLLIRGIFLIEHQNLGFQADHLLTAGVTLDAAQYKDASQQVHFVQNLLPRLERLPGVEAVAATSDLPASGAESAALKIRGQPDSPANRQLTALDVVVTTDYFRTAAIPLQRGRTFTPADTSTSPRVVLINEEFVRRYLAGQEPIGKQINLNSGATKPEWSEIVGVVRNVKTYSEETHEDPEVYEAFLQRPVPSFSFMLRASSDPNTLASALRGTVAQVDPDLPLFRLMSMPTVIHRQSGGNSFFSGVLGSFAFLALILASIGIYGLIAYSVGRRTREVGIRMAMGARSGDVMGMILREGTKMAAIGAAIGLAMALPLPRVFDSIFYGLHVREPRLYFVVPVVIFLTAAFATYIPARRAAKVDPMVALRYE
jgi:putative ABC transport system permease protein